MKTKTYETEYGELPAILSGSITLFVTCLSGLLFLWVQFFSSADPEILMAVKLSILFYQGTNLVLALTLIYVPSSVKLLTAPISLQALRFNQSAQHKNVVSPSFQIEDRAI